MDLEFSAGASNCAMQCIDIAIIDSPTVEEDETFIVTLTTLSSTVTLGNDVTTVIIRNIDSKLYKCPYSLIVLCWYIATM